MRHRIPLAFVPLLFALPLVAQQEPATPFGFEMGTSVAALDSMGAETAGETPGIYKLDTAPQPHPAFEYYAVVATEATGVCKVLAIGNDIDTNSFGQQLRQGWDNVAEAVAAKYGGPETVDRVMPGSIWDAPEDFMMGLLQQERYLAAGWTPENGANLPDNLLGILLQAKATNSSTGYLSLGYEFTNFTECKAAIEAEQNAVF